MLSDQQGAPREKDWLNSKHPGHALSAEGPAAGHEEDEPSPCATAGRWTDSAQQDDESLEDKPDASSSSSGDESVEYDVEYRPDACNEVSPTEERPSEHLFENSGSTSPLPKVASLRESQNLMEMREADDEESLLPGEFGELRFSTYLAHKPTQTSHVDTDAVGRNRRQSV